MTEKIEYKEKLKTEVPLSEDQSKFREDWSAQNCIDELRRLAEMDTTKFLSRNYVRNTANMSESTWNRYFGTFEEFKRQAGIKLTRQQHNMEKSIAKHASTDHYKELDERHNWGDDYKKISKSREKVILVGTDFHDMHVDPFFLRVFLDTAKRLLPTDICLGGDIFDLPEFGNYKVDPRLWKPGKRVKFVHEKVFKPLRAIDDNVNIDMLEGNHEYRLARESSDFTNALVLLEDVHGKDLRWLLGLDKFEINYISKASANAFTKGDVHKELRKNWKVYYDSFLAHHYPLGQRMGMPGFHGHHHKHIVSPHYSPVFGPYEWHQVGAGHIRTATYTNSDDFWQNGFLIVYINPSTRKSITEYIAVTDMAVSGGKMYRRRESEKY